MGTQVYTNGVTLSDAAEFDRFDTAAYPVLTGVAGTNTVTATGPANYALSSSMPPIIIIPANTNTGATTLAVTPSGSAALTAKNVFFKGVALNGGELVSGVPSIIIYDGTQFQILGSSKIQSGTVYATTSTTAFDWSGIPSGTKRITLNLAGISTNGTNAIMVQIGASGAVETTGYVGITETATATGAWQLLSSAAAVGIYSGAFTITLLDIATNTWCFNGNLARTDVGASFVCSGYKAVSSTLARVRLTTNGGTDAFDAGLASIIYE